MSVCQSVWLAVCRSVSLSVCLCLCMDALHALYAVYAPYAFYELNAIDAMYDAMYACMRTYMHTYCVSHENYVHIWQNVSNSTDFMFNMSPFPDLRDMTAGKVVIDRIKEGFGVKVHHASRINFKSPESIALSGFKLVYACFYHHRFHQYSSIFVQPCFTSVIHHVFIVFTNPVAIKTYKKQPFLTDEICILSLFN